jgi:hypothetical protein
MAGATGLEPATSGVTGRRSNQLSYTPANLDRGDTSYLGAPGVSSNSPRASSDPKRPPIFVIPAKAGIQEHVSCPSPARGADDLDGAVRVGAAAASRKGL